MELIIAIIVLGAIVYVGYNMLNKEKDDGSHPLDTLGKPAEAPYKVEPPVLTTKIDGIGHESVETKPTKKKAPAKPKTAAPKTAKPKVAKAKPATDAKPKKPKTKKA